MSTGTRTRRGGPVTQLQSIHSKGVVVPTYSALVRGNDRLLVGKVGWSEGRVGRRADGLVQRVHAGCLQKEQAKARQQGGVGQLQNSHARACSRVRS